MTGPDAGSRVERLLLDCVERGRMPGAVWWIEGPGNDVRHGAVGRASADAPATLATPYDLASLTKPLATALLLVLLEGQGEIELDAPLGPLLPAVGDGHLRDATLLDLAVHRAGLPAWRPPRPDTGDVEALVRRIAAGPRAVPPGTTLYSDLGYVLLGRVLERVTGRRLDRLFDARVAGPLALPRLAFAGRTRAFGDAAPTEEGNVYEREMAGAEGEDYSWRPSIPAGEVHDANAHALGGVAGHAGLFGTAEGVAAVAREILRPRTLALGERGRRRLLEESEPGSGRTVGFVLAAASRAARGVLDDAAPGHTGFTGTSLWLEPARDRFFVLLANRVHPRVPRTDFQCVRRAFHRLAARGLAA